jgi:hypothetical protein
MPPPEDCQRGSQFLSQHMARTADVLWIGRGMERRHMHHCCQQGPVFEQCLQHAQSVQHAYRR